MKLLLFFVFSFTILSSVYAQDSVKLTNRSFDSSLFANDDTLTVNDYLSGLGKVFQTLNKAISQSQTIPAIELINQKMDLDDSALAIIKHRIQMPERILNIKNVQMYATLLDKIFADTKSYNSKLNQFDVQLDSIKGEVYKMRADTLTKSIFSHKNLITSLQSELVTLYTKWKKADSVIRKTNHLIDNSLARTSATLISIEELQTQTKAQLKSTGLRAFTKESRFLWEPHPLISTSLHNSYVKALADERKITAYYFSDTKTQLYLLFATGLLFFYWIFYNQKSVKKINKLKAFDFLQLRYVNSFPFFTSCIVLLSIAPLFDLNAPSIYFEIIVLFLMIVLTVHFHKTFTIKLFYCWLTFILISVTLLFIRLLGLQFYVQRNLIFLINLISAAGGFYLIRKYKVHYQRLRIVFIVGWLYIIFNSLALVCNVFGRITLMNIFSLTAIYSFIQAIGLTIFIQASKEAFLMQIQGSRVRKGYPEHFDFKDISKGLSRLLGILSFIIWFIVFTTNLNLYNSFYSSVMDLLTAPRKLGSFAFSFSGIILFLIIIWCANFLQKYISYFFGDVGEDAAFENVGVRSKLLITRLILLIGGFLLAVLASGLPIDRITVILGALSVGIGLGLQSIVNNFVSGVILIFDRPLRIGDTVEIGDKKGRVKEISVRASTLLTADGAEVIIPNGVILGSNIVNWTLSNSHIRADISFNIEKVANPESLKEDLVTIVMETPNVLNQKPAEILISNISAVSSQIKIYFWCKDVIRLEQLKTTVYQSVYTALESRGIKIL